MWCSLLVSYFHAFRAAAAPSGLPNGGGLWAVLHEMIRPEPDSLPPGGLTAGTRSNGPILASGFGFWILASGFFILTSHTEGGT